MLLASFLSKPARSTAKLFRFDVVIVDSGLWSGSSGQPYHIFSPACAIVSHGVRGMRVTLVIQQRYLAMKRGPSTKLRGRSENRKKRERQDPPPRRHLLPQWRCYSNYHRRTKAVTPTISLTCPRPFLWRYVVVAAGLGLRCGCSSDDTRGSSWEPLRI